MIATTTLSIHCQLIEPVYGNRWMLTVIGGSPYYTDPFDKESNEKSYGTQEKAGNGCVLYSTIGGHFDYTVEL
ncbi:hypothetical protein DPV78_012915 [Talaromyces pinophilus]|nr:hypothetical protein DPV78_012915 [Talaromyces pinophilus]